MKKFALEKCEKCEKSEKKNFSHFLKVLRKINIFYQKSARKCEKSAKKELLALLNNTFQRLKNFALEKCEKCEICWLALTNQNFG